ncbi:hypothetical protein ABEY63_25650 [Priestia aryabhattai]|uniref:hypothetical protein n=1 Tax=Priestia aryabhattai TaxID=412384 RepID=UPI003D27D730
MDYTKISISIPNESLEKIDKSNQKWGDRSRVITNHLSYFHHLLHTQDKWFETHFSEGEKRYIYSCFNSMIIDFRFTPGRIKFTLLDTMSYPEGEMVIDSLNLDRDALIEKIQELDAIQAYTILNKSEEFWANSNFKVKENDDGN